jgi:hypothetical protein
VCHRPFNIFCHYRVQNKTGRIRRVKYWEIIADNLSKAGWELGLCRNCESQRANNLDC